MSRAFKLAAAFAALAAVCFGAQGWQPFEFKDYGFRVMLPQEPEKKVLLEEPGSFVVSFTVRGEESSFAMTVVQVRDDEGSRKNMPKTPAETEKYLDRVRNGYLKSFGGGAKLDDEKAHSIQGFPARWIRGEATINGQGYVSEGEFVLVGRRIYSVVAIGLKGGNDSVLQEFLKSFELIDENGQRLKANPN